MKYLLLILFACFHCSSSLQHESLSINGNSQLYFYKFKSQLTIALDSATGSTDESGFLAKYERPDRKRNKRILDLLNDNFHKCLIWNQLFIYPTSFFDESGFIIRIESSEETTFLHMVRKMPGSDEVAIRKIIFSRYNNKFRYAHIGCFYSNDFINEYLKIVRNHVGNISLTLPINDQLKNIKIIKFFFLISLTLIILLVFTIGLLIVLPLISIISASESKLSEKNKKLLKWLIYLLLFSLMCLELIRTFFYSGI